MVTPGAFWLSAFHEAAVKTSAVAAIISGLHWGRKHFQVGTSISNGQIGYGQRRRG